MLRKAIQRATACRWAASSHHTDAIKDFVTSAPNASFIVTIHDQIMSATDISKRRRSARRAAQIAPPPAASGPVFIVTRRRSRRHWCFSKAAQRLPAYAATRTVIFLSDASPTWSCAARAFSTTFILAKPERSPLAIAGQEGGGRGRGAGGRSAHATHTHTLLSIFHGILCRDSGASGRQICHAAHIGVPTDPGGLSLPSV